MSYSIIKSITFDNFNRTARWRSACNNVSPRTYEANSLREGADYDGFKRDFASWLFGGEAQFLPSCKSVAHRVYKLVNRSFGMRIDRTPFSQAMQRFPYDEDPETGCVSYNYVDEELREKYMKLREDWETAYLKVLDEFIGVPKQDGTLDLFEEVSNG